MKPRREFSTSIQAGKLQGVSSLLKARYGSPRLGNKRDPVDEIVYIVLSAKSSERAYSRAYRSLRAAYPRWEEMSRSPVAGIARRIRGAGLGAKKGRQLRGIMRELERRYGRRPSAALKQLSTAELEESLTALPGVGLKSARCVMMYSLGRRVFPVDTHCRRVLARLGFIGDERLTDASQNRIQALVPESVRYDLHVNLVAHGRAICTSVAPSCDACFLNLRCAYYRRRPAGLITHRRRGTARQAGPIEELGSVQPGRVVGAGAL